MAEYFTIRNPAILRNCVEAIREAGDNARVTIAPAQRSGGQNNMFHAICSDLAKSALTFAGKRRSAEEWKALIVSGHSVATGHGGEVIPGIEGEFVAIRESTSRMGVGRASSLIEYALAYCATNGVELSDTRKGGWLDERAA